MYDNYRRYRKYTIEEVRDLWVKAQDSRHEHIRKNGTKYYTYDRVQIADGITVKMDSQRYQVFFKCGTECVSCGLKGRYFWLEQDKSQTGTAYHFNLYGIDADGNEVMLTKDHIIPKSKGGTSSIENYQTMCDRCNEKKSNKIV